MSLHIYGMFIKFDFGIFINSDLICSDSSLYVVCNDSSLFDVRSDSSLYAAKSKQNIRVIIVRRHCGSSRSPCRPFGRFTRAWAKP